MIDTELRISVLPGLFFRRSFMSRKNRKNEGSRNMKEIFERVSIRKYTDQPVEEEKILAILRAAMAAPSAGNQQPWEFFVVQERGMLEAGLDARRRRKVVDKVAAAVMLQAWLDHRRSTWPADHGGGR